ncbi:hypothetical protein B0H67DRAFT_153431 [Lasiosphaeris hirsuta]|uniref:Uncharacterized protein n=1 Tax=Lasiosphaeris hirsuta TaxID=260670 RepID=A0AA40E1R8_9PEZI|nr:hypothetical protein B0H67DRAFT_153431 [Lasiosphaeris hirsuta]
MKRVPCTQDYRRAGGATIIHARWMMWLFRPFCPLSRDGLAPRYIHTDLGSSPSASTKSWSTRASRISRCVLWILGGASRDLLKTVQSRSIGVFVCTPVRIMYRTCTHPRATCYSLPTHLTRYPTRPLRDCLPCWLPGCAGWTFSLRSKRGQRQRGAAVRARRLAPAEMEQKYNKKVYDLASSSCDGSQEAYPRLIKSGLDRPTKVLTQRFNRHRGHRWRPIWLPQISDWLGVDPGPASIDTHPTRHLSLP